MPYKKAAIATALGTLLGMGSVATADAAIIHASFDGLFAMLDPVGSPMQNTSYPYYGDLTWGYGRRTQVSGTFTYDTSTGAGSMAVNPFYFMNAGTWDTHYIALQAIGDGLGGSGTLLAGKWLYDWNFTLNINAGFILDAAGFLGEGPFTAGQAILGVGAIPASNGMLNGKHPIGAAPVATTAWDTDYHNDPTCVMSNSCLIGNDGIGGDPLDNGPYPGFNPNFDITSIYIDSVSTVPAPAAVWLLGSGLLCLVGVARHRRE